MKTSKASHPKTIELEEELSLFVAHTFIVHEKDWQKIRKLSKLVTKKAVR
jgi:hypothetical protein